MLHPSMAEAEKAKYEKMWGHKEYLKHSPGKWYSDTFLELSEARAGETAIDLGCGRGEGGKAIAKGGLKVTYLDLMKVKYARLAPFVQQPLWNRIPGRDHYYTYGYCCDVMEHIPIEYVTLVLERIRAATKFAFFGISNIPDNCGQLIGSPLHMTVMPYEWWLEKMKEIGTVIDARDMLSQSLYYVECNR